MSDVQICNIGLIRVGEKTITALNEGTRQANTANTLYADLRDAVLRAHPWNFATVRKQLAQSARTPAFEFTYQYPVPADFLRSIIVSDNTQGTEGVTYRLEYESNDKRVVLTDATQIYMKYVRQVTETAEMDPLFRDALSYRLAMDFAVILRESNVTAERMERRYSDVLSYARSIDGMEDSAESRPEGSWTTARRGTSDSWWDQP